MNEAIRKAITNALIELNIGNNMERLDKRISTLTDKVTELETFVVGNNDVFRQARLRQRLHCNTTGMGGVHHHQGNNHHVPDDPYAKINFTIPSFLGHYDAEGYLVGRWR